MQRYKKRLRLQSFIYESIFSLIIQVLFPEKILSDYLYFIAFCFEFFSNFLFEIALYQNLSIAC